ncbi:MAG: hypothetical protein E5299_00816 [Burkholderia gladioli]|nr:MAG: hypothetical protein E5299_00816 [Burkholderia gladioli]
MKGVRQHGYSKRRRWRKVHLALNANMGQVHAALMTHQSMADGDALAKLLDQIPRDEQIDVIGDDGAYDTKRGRHSPTRGCIALGNAPQKAHKRDD